MKEKTGGISEDETTNLRAAFMSLGLDNSGDEIGREHSKNVDSGQNMKYFQILQTEAKKKGGVLQSVWLYRKPFTQKSEKMVEKGMKCDKKGISVWKLNFCVFQLQSQPGHVPR